MIVLARGPGRMQIGKMNAFWYKIATHDGTVRWVYSYFLNLDRTLFERISIPAKDSETGVDVRRIDIETGKSLGLPLLDYRNLEAPVTYDSSAVGSSFLRSEMPDAQIRAVLAPFFNKIWRPVEGQTGRVARSIGVSEHGYNKGDPPGFFYQDDPTFAEPPNSITNVRLIGETLFISFKVQTHTALAVKMPRIGRTVFWYLPVGFDPSRPAAGGIYRELPAGP